MYERWEGLIIISKKSVLEDYDELMDWGHDTIGDFKYDLNNLKIRDRIAQLQEENAALKKQIEEGKLL
jgi:hypothetical protein